MAPDASPAFLRFTASLDASSGSREELEDFDLNALDQLEGAERDQAEQLLVIRLEGTPDVRAVRALGRLGTPTAMRALKKVAKRYRRKGACEDLAAQAAHLELTALGAVRDPLRRLLQDLQKGDIQTRRLSAYHLARAPKDPRVLPALTAALDDPDEMTRFWVAEAMMEALGLSAYACVAGTRIWLVMHWLRVPFPHIRRMALADLEKVKEEQREGRLPPRVGEMPEKSPTFQAYLASLRCPVGQEPWADDLDIESLRRLEGDERGWAENALINTLDTVDVRRPKALAAMGSIRAIEPLEALRSKASGEMIRVIDQALLDLSLYL